MDDGLRQIEIDGLRRVVVYGPESTGKTTLARQLAEHFGAAWVPEYARAYIRAKIRSPARCNWVRVPAHGAIRSVLVGSLESPSPTIFCPQNCRILMFSVWIR
jgi:hypothetical protein